jgi:AcrR family transcriptional regulator
VEGPARPLGLRERNKRDKAKRIVEAASAVFTERGFDDAAVREIAERAGVGLGTLFAYASNKRDLVFLIFIDALENLTAEAFAAAAPDGGFVKQVSALFERYYRYFDRNHALSRILLREIFFFSEGVHAARMSRHWNDVIDRLAQLVRGAQARGAAARKADAEGVARIVFALYQAEVRRWLAEPRPNPKRGIARFAELLALQMRGFAP